MYYLVYLIQSNSFPNVNMNVKSFKDILDLYAFGLDNRFFQLGPGTYVIIGPNGTELIPGDIYAEIDKIKAQRKPKATKVTETAGVK